MKSTKRNSVSRTIHQVCAVNYPQTPPIAPSLHPCLNEVWTDWQIISGAYGWSERAVSGTRGDRLQMAKLFLMPSTHVVCAIYTRHACLSGIHVPCPAHVYEGWHAVGMLCRPLPGRRTNEGHCKQEPRSAHPSTQTSQTLQTRNLNLT